MLVTVICTQCGNSVERKPYQVKNNKKTYCSNACRSAWMSENMKGKNNTCWRGGRETLKTVNCSECGKEILRKSKYISDTINNFCSKDCEGNWKKKNMRGENAVRWDGGKVTIVCAQCGKSKEIPKCQVTENNFCNSSCMGKWASINKRGAEIYNYVEKINVGCSYCGKDKFVTPKKVEQKQNHFCDFECMGKWQSVYRGAENVHNYKKENRIIRLCSCCGKELERDLWQQRYRKKAFCDHACYGKWLSENNIEENHPAWLGGPLPYPPGWRYKLKEIIRNRDERTCQLCGIKEADSGRRLDVHHIDYDKNNLNHSNLISLCMSCHRRTNHRRDEWITYFQNINNLQEVLHG